MGLLLWLFLRGAQPGSEGLETLLIAKVAAAECQRPEGTSDGRKHAMDIRGATGLLTKLGANVTKCHLFRETFSGIL